MGLKIPRQDEAANYALTTVRHVSGEEYFRLHMGLSSCDPQHPHDLTGMHHKFTPAVFRGLSLKNPFDPKKEPGSAVAFYRAHTEPSVLLHREGQYHHWHYNHPPAWSKLDDMLESAMDTVWAIVEGRYENGGPHTYEEAVAEVKIKAPQKLWAVEHVIPLMQRLPRPEVAAITSLDDIPNIGISPKVHAKIRKAVEDMRMMVHDTWGYKI